MSQILSVLGQIVEWGVGLGTHEAQHSRLFPTSQRK